MEFAIHALKNIFPDVLQAWRAEEQANTKETAI